MSERERQLERVRAARARMGMAPPSSRPAVVPRTRVDGAPGTHVPAPVPRVPVAVPEPPRPSPRRVLLVSKFREVLMYVSTKYQCHPDDIRGDRRHKHLIPPRREAWYILAKHYGWSRPRIAHFFRRDHSTITHGIAEYEKSLQDL